MAGRPKHWFTIDLDNIDDTVDEILKACKTPKVREGFQNLIIRLKDSLFEKSDSYSQTDEFNSFQFIEMLSSVSENDVAFILDNIWVQLGAEQQMCSLYQFLEDMSLDSQKVFFTMLGKMFNQNLFDESISSLCLVILSTYLYSDIFI